jgi:hypothetical protein
MGARTAAAALALFAALAAPLAPAPAAAQGAAKARPKSAVILQLEAFGSFLNDGVGGSNLAVSAGYGGRAGWRHGAFGFFGEVTCDRWLATELRTEWTPGVLDAGVGAELLFARGRVRSSVAGGASTLLFDTAFHDKGATGLYIDFRPLSLRFPLWPGLVVELSPLGFDVLSPALGEPHIRRIEYRTTIALEVAL